jgi:hypothetical protein
MPLDRVARNLVYGVFKRGKNPSLASPGMRSWKMDLIRALRAAVRDAGSKRRPIEASEAGRSRRTMQRGGSG